MIDISGWYEFKLPDDYFKFDAEYARDHFFDGERMIRVKQEVHNRYRSNPTPLPAHLRDCLRLLGTEHILDLGCGNGFILREIVPYLRDGGLAVGLDISASLIEVAKQRLADEWMPVDWIVSSADDLSMLGDNTFDRAMANYMIHYVPDLDKCFEEVKRILRPGGYLVITTDSLASMHEMYRVHFDAAQEVGFPERLFKATPKGKLSLETGRKILAPYFKRVELLRYPDSLVFKESDPFMKFYTIGHNYCCARSVSASDLSTDMFEKLHAAVRRRVEAIIEERGAFEVSKLTGSFLCFPE